MTVTAPVANGRPQRKLLSEQLDRLDSIIDALADGLPEAVAAAARQGTQSAVKDAIIEIMTNPELRALMQSIAPAAPAAVPTPTEPAPTPGVWTQLKAKLAAARAAITERYQAAREAITTTTRTLSSMMPLRRIVFVALGVGVVGALLGYSAPAGVAAVIAGIGGVVSALAAQVAHWFRRSTQLFRTT